MAARRVGKDAPPEPDEYKSLGFRVRGLGFRV